MEPFRADLVLRHSHYGAIGGSEAAEGANLHRSQYRQQFRRIFSRQKFGRIPTMRQRVNFLYERFNVIRFRVVVEEIAFPFEARRLGRVHKQEIGPRTDYANPGREI